MPVVDREAEIVRLGAAYGVPACRDCVLDVNHATFSYWEAAQERCKYGEVVLFIRRHNGRLILHTKGFYPAGAFRVPSGGIHPGESLVAAALRETQEETGLQVAVERFLAVVSFQFHWEGRSLTLPSYLFVLREVEGHLEAQDRHENIVAFSEVDPGELGTVAECLEHVPDDWHDWGLFRAFPHRLAVELFFGQPGSPAHSASLA